MVRVLRAGLVRLPHDGDDRPAVLRRLAVLLHRRADGDLVGDQHLPVWPLCKQVGASPRDPRLRKHRFRAVMVTSGFIGAILSLVLFVPAPLHTTTEGVVWLPESAQVQRSDRRLRRTAARRPGQAVRVGDALMRVSEPTLAARHAPSAAPRSRSSRRNTPPSATKPAEAEVTRLELEKERASLARDRERAAVW